MSILHSFVLLLVSWCVLPYPLAAIGAGMLSPAASYPKPFPYDRLRAFVEEQDFRSAVAQIDHWLLASPSSTATPLLLVEKAKILYADQQHAEAQEVFLTALNALSAASGTAMSEEESKAFDALFPSYEASTQSAAACERLLEEARALYRQHPSFCSLEHYIAASLANRGQYVEFFDVFSRAVRFRPESFLRYKTQGVLHLRLFEASTSEEKRECHRQEAVRCFKEAFSRQPKDATLLIKLMFILSPAERADLLRSSVASLMRLQMPLRRMDYFFLIQQAIDVREVEVARQMIDKARSWYHYSRALNDLCDQLEALGVRG